MSTFEVVRSRVDGWDIRRAGEAQALSNFPTRELAEQAARIESELEGEAGDADAVDIRQDIFSEAPGEDLNLKRTMLGVAAVVLFMIALIAVISFAVSKTGFAG